MFICLIAAVVLLRVGLVLVAHATDPRLAIDDDTAHYVNSARSLAANGTFNRSPSSSVPEFAATPGYPAFVATIYKVFGEDDLAILLVQAVLSALSVLLAILVALRLSGSALVALGVGVLLALDPLQAASTAQLMTEALSTILMTLTAYAGIRFAQAEFAPRWGVAYGVSLVAATFVRPTTYYFPIVVVGVLVVVAARNRQRRRALVRGGVAFLLPCVLLLGAWNVRNDSEVGSWRFSSAEAINLYWYRAASVVAKEDGIGFEQAQLQLTEQLNRGAVPKFNYAKFANGELPPAWESMQGAYYDRAHQAARDILLGDPLRAGRAFVGGVYAQLIQSGWKSSFEMLGAGSLPGPLVAVGLPLVWGIEALALFGIVLALRRSGPLLLAHVLTIALVAYSIVVSSGAPPEAGWRFRMPIWPIMVVYAVIGLQQIGLWLQERHHGPSSISQPAGSTHPAGV